MSFVKYHGLGNDFILIDNRDSSTPRVSCSQATKVCDRNFGVGADGIILAMPGTDGCDYTMKVINSDGTEAQMCGNGLRCFALFLRRIERSATSEFKIKTGAGVLLAKILPNNSVEVDMGEPILSPVSIPTALESIQLGGNSFVAATIDVLGSPYQISAVGMGNPHGVIFVESLESMNPPFSEMGPAVSGHSCFPQKANAEFVEVLSTNHVRTKVWERGAGPTLACGTGACAIVVAGVLNGRTERVCTVSLPGGDLLIEWKESNNRVIMTGPAVEVFEGSLSASLLVQ